TSKRTFSDDPEISTRGNKSERKNHGRHPNASSQEARKARERVSSTGTVTATIIDQSSARDSPAAWFVLAKLCHCPVSVLSFYGSCISRQVFHADQPGHAGKENYSGHKQECHVHICVTTNVSQEPECLHIAERVDNENVYRECRRAYGWQRNVGQSRVRGTCVQEQEKDREKHGNPRRRKRNVKRRDKKRTRDQHPDSRDPEIGTWETRTQPVGNNASQKCRDQTRDHGNQAKNRHAHVGTLVAITQIRRHPEAQTARDK